MKWIIMVICAVLLALPVCAEKIKVTGKNSTTGNFTTVVICALKWIKKRKEDEQEFLEILGKINEETIRY